MALMLALTRKLLEGHQGVVAGKYRERQLDPALTSEYRFAFNWLGFPDVTELGGKTLGLVGLGEIGREVARRARAFDMSLLYHQRHRIPEEFEQMLGVRKVALELLLQESDVVSLHIPHTPESECLIDRRRLGLMKSSAFLINTARGGLIEEEALVQSLREGKLAGAGLDVFREEPLPADHPLLKLDNVILAPHTGGGSGGGQRTHISQVLENIGRVARGIAPEHLVA
jgi:phosphoglycerate dehydrogenase-like enzyme